MSPCAASVLGYADAAPEGTTVGGKCISVAAHQGAADSASAKSCERLCDSHHERVCSVASLPLGSSRGFTVFGLGWHRQSQVALCGAGDRSSTLCGVITELQLLLPGSMWTVGIVRGLRLRLQIAPFLRRMHVAARSVTALMQKGVHTSTSLQEPAATCTRVGKLEVTSL